MGYYIDLETISVDSYKSKIESAWLPPSRKILKERTDERFGYFNSIGIANLIELMNALRKKDKFNELSKVECFTGSYLPILLRELNSILPKPIRIRDFRRISTETVAKLETIGIKDTVKLADNKKTIRNMRIILIVFSIFFLTLNCYSQVDTFSDKYVDSVIIKFKQKWKIPGISAAIAKDGRLIYAKGFGYADTINKEPVTTNSLFRTASCAKTVTAIGVMKLIEDNKLSLDDKVFGENGILNGSNYKDIADSNVYNITVRNLLQQTVGWLDIDIIGENDASYALKAPIPAGIAENVKYILQQKLDFLSSTAFRYSDFNYLFLGEIISKVVQKNHVDYILSEILHPIGIYTTVPGKSELIDRAANEVIYYDYNGEMLPSAFDTSKLVPESYSFNMDPMISSGGWISRPIDMVKIILSIDGLNSPPDILNQNSINLLSSKPENIKTRYAMGMFVPLNNAWFHSGACTWGTSALWFKTADNLCFAITCNTLPTSIGSEEDKYDEMGKYLRELIGFLPEKLESIKVYPDFNLFESMKLDN